MVRGRGTSESSSFTRNMLPVPGVLATVISPPMVSTSILVMVRPSPVPVAARAGPLRARSNGRNTRSRSSG